MPISRPLLLAYTAHLLCAACGPESAPREAPPPAPAAPQASAPAAAPAPEPAPTPAATTSVRGKLLDHRGQPLALAHVQPRSAALKDPPRIEVAADGSFEVAAPPGVLHLTMTGVDHLSKNLTLILGPTPVEMTVHLPTHPRADPKSPAKLLLWRTADASEPEDHPFLKNSTDKDGRRSITLDLPAGEIRYQLLGHLQSGRSTNGTQSTGHEYDGEGDYRSRLIIPASPGGPTTITFDPALFPPPDLPGSVTFADPNTPVARTAALIARVQALSDAHLVRLFAAMERGEPQPTHPEGWDAMQTELATIARDDPDRPLQHLAAILYFSHPPGTRPEAPQLAATALRDIPPIDPLWTVTPQAFRAMIEAVPDPDSYNATVERLIAEHPDPELGASYLLTLLTTAFTADDMATAKIHYDRLQTPRFLDTGSQQFSAMFDPSRPLLAGRPMPALDLDLLALDGSPARFDLERLKGRPVLVDVWATWCKPCIAEMPELDKLYKQHGRGPKGLQFVSIAMDTAEAGKTYRGGKWPMPWQHLIVPPTQHDAVYKALGIIGIPATILLDASGQIVAATPDLELAEVPQHLAMLASAPAPATTP